MLLDDLPIELLLLVTSHLTTPEYSAFRLVCRSLKSGTYESWAEEFFSTRQFSLQFFSLNVLLSIARHELGRKMKRLIVGTDMITPSRTTELLTMEQQTKHAGHLKTQEYMTTTGLDRQMLSEAISHLPNLTSIEVRNFWSDFQGGRIRDQQPWKSYGWSVYQNDTGMSLKCDSSDHGTGLSRTLSDIFQKTLAAAVDCQGLKRLVAHLRPERGMGRWAVLHGRAFFIPRTLEARYKAALQHLETLMIAIGTRASLGGLSKEELGPELLDFMSLVPNLNHLRLNWGTGRVPSPISRVVAPMAPKLHSLRILELGTLTLREDEIAHLKAFASLQELSLFRIDLCTGSWELLLSQLVASMPRLRTLNINRVRQMVHASNGVQWMARLAFKVDAIATVTDMDDTSLQSRVTITDKREHDLTAAVKKITDLIVVDDEAFRRARGATFDPLVADSEDDSEEENILEEAHLDEDEDQDEDED